jgi:septal ring factor EnvC (AmiA/AmiB activator)
MYCMVLASSIFFLKAFFPFFFTVVLMQEEKMWQDRLQASMKQAEEHRLATLASNRKIGALKAELGEAQKKLATESRRSEQLSTSVCNMQKDLQSMTAALDEKTEQLEQARCTFAELDRKAAMSASQHQNDLNAASDKEAKLAKQVNGYFICCACLYVLLAYCLLS